MVEKSGPSDKEPGVCTSTAAAGLSSWRPCRAGFQEFVTPILWAWVYTLWNLGFRGLGLGLGFGVGGLGFTVKGLLKRNKGF